ncbi:MAG: MBL fold metallo-hydrolase [Acidobacteriaceae bacterium]|jgi:metallo-beta-lactamase family protein|nr:MBL fold metallo-hydrolase [Acidobacteriaceae bacterium]
MSIRLHFWGAAQTVTGSSHHIECAGQNVLLDCGLYQGRREEAHEINSHLALPANEVSTVVLSHAHIDHSGDLPLLAKQGYRGAIYATPATIDLCDPMLADSAHIQESDAEFVNKRFHRRTAVGIAEQPAIPPLYGAADAVETLKLFRPLELHTPTLLGSAIAGVKPTADAGFTVTTFEAGHMLGSTCVLVEGREKGQTTRLLFSGDVGRRLLPIIHDPDAAPVADYLIMESTYGNRIHEPIGPVKQKLAELVNRTAQNGGHIVMPAFAVERTQQVVMLLHELIDEEAIPDMPIFVDSPLGVKVTQVFQKHTELWDEGALAFSAKAEDPFGWKRLKYLTTVEESKALNGLHMPFIVIASSGMCEAGRVLHHLKNSIEDPRNLVLITGYQAPYTLGSKLLQKLPEVPIFGEPFRLRAQVDNIDALSGHADQHELLKWMEPVVPTLKKVFLVHGELDAQMALKAEIEKMYKLDVVVPKRGDRVEIG